MSALQNFVIIELAESVAGEYCGKLLADFGAEIIKIEKPGCGSPTRTLGPRVAGDAHPERSGLFAYLNTNKASVTLDVQNATGVAMLAKLLRRADAVIDDHAPGWLAGVGLDPAEFQEQYARLVLCAITPFGQAPPADRVNAEDLTIFQASGWGYHTPSGMNDEVPPLKGAGRFLVSYEAGLEAAMCVTACLHGREETGRGRFIDVSKQAVMASRVDYVLGQMVAGEMDVGTSRTAFDLWGPAAIFACREGFAYIWLSDPLHWKGLRQLLNDPEWMREFPEHWLEREATPERVATTRKHIAAWLRTQDKHEAAAAAQKLGVMLVPVNNASDLPHLPQYRFREFFKEVDHPVLGRALYPTVPYKLSATPARIVTPAPLLGQHTDMKLAALPGAATIGSA
ncbi:MAG TPA: CoA transferase [Acetobacteraceae bacterium]|nr:CoA transferase [Acetobacteraceae bacterium]